MIVTRRINSWVLLLALISFPAMRTLKAQVTVTHVANEGFLLEGGGKKVLVDALFDGLPGYRRASPETALRLTEALPPFDGIDLILATHFHDDHFSPGPVRRHLRANSHALFVSTPQAVEKLLRGRPDLSARAVAVFPAEGVRDQRDLNGVLVEILNLHHGRDRNPPVENLGFIVHLGGRRVLHVGDTEATDDEFSRLRLGDDPVDVALLPGWFLTSRGAWGKAVRDVIRPHAIGAMHLAAEDAPSSYFGGDRTLRNRVETIQRQFPGVEVFVHEMQRRVF